MFVQFKFIKVEIIDRLSCSKCSRQFVAENKGLGSLGTFFLKDLGWNIKQGIIL